jgi:crossover junction endodeoxyribonuclease RusA
MFRSKDTLAFLQLGKFYLRGQPKFGQLPVIVELLIFPPDKRKRDIDNLAKCACDLLMYSGIIDDDFQIQRLLIERSHVIKDGLIKITVSEYLK